MSRLNVMSNGFTLAEYIQLGQWNDDINKRLRRGDRLRPTQLEVVDTLRAVTPKEYSVLWRGLRTHHLLREVKNGLWTPRGLESTSESKDVAREFLGRGFQRDHSLVMLVGALGRSIDFTGGGKAAELREVIVMEQSFAISFLGARGSECSGYWAWVAHPPGIDVPLSTLVAMT